MDGSSILELSIPSVLGSEKTAMEKAAMVAREMGFSEDRVQDLKTAVAEACIIAMEHGNKLDDSIFLGITLTPTRSIATQVHSVYVNHQPSRQV